MWALFWWGFWINVFSTHSHQRFWAEIFCEWSNESAFPYRHIIIWLIHILPTHSGIFLLPLDIKPEICISIDRHNPHAFENVEMKFSKYHHSSTTLIVLILRLDEAVLRESSPPGGFCSPTASEQWPCGFHGEKLLWSSLYYLF